MTDPHAVPAIWSIFAGGGEKEQLVAAQLLGQIDSPRGSRGLALLALFSDSPTVRRCATETLRGRDSREYFGALIAMLRKRIKYEVRPVGGPGSPGVLFVEGKQFNVQRLYAPPAMPVVPVQPNDLLTTDAYGLPLISRYLGTTIETHSVAQSHSTDVGPVYPMSVLEKAGLNPYDEVRYRWIHSTVRVQTTKTPVVQSMEIPIGQLMLQYQTSALVAQQELSSDVALVEGYNDVVGKLNDRVSQVLKDVSGQDLGEDPQSWTAWWANQLGYAYRPAPSTPVPTVVQNVPLAYVPQGVATTTMTQAGVPTTTTMSYDSTGLNDRLHGSCFKVGTPVHTLGGPLPIETIQVGDQVLVQDGSTGALGYQPVVEVFHNPPDATLRIDLDGDVIVATTIHRFWKAGVGRVMARDLRPGDVIRTLAGRARRHRRDRPGAAGVQPEGGSGPEFLCGQGGHPRPRQQPCGARNRPL